MRVERVSGEIKKLPGTHTLTLWKGKKMIDVEFKVNTSSTCERTRPINHGAQLK